MVFSLFGKFVAGVSPVKSKKPKEPPVSTVVKAEETISPPVRAQPDWQIRIFEHNKDFYHDDITTTKDETPKIRLLKVHPGAFEDPLVATLTTKSLDSSIKYEALSYTWGQKHTNDEYTLTLNGLQGFRISRTVYLALRYFRDTRQVKVIWIDAVCINQTNLPEKSEQVRLMSKVFGMAEYVLCWLGTCGSGPDIGHNCTDHQVRRNRKGEDEIHCKKRPLLHVDHDREDQWWNRIWTVQECCLAKDIKVLIGPHIYRYGTLYQTLHNRYVDKQPHWSVDLTAACFSLGFRQGMMQKANIPSYLLNLYGDSRYTLYRCLETTKFFRASEPKDKIYGLAGMCCEDIDVDYKKDLVDICIETAVKTFDTQGHLNCITGTWPKFEPGICSWLPDFSEVPPKSLLTTHNPSWMNVEGRPERSHYSLKGRRLTVSGVHLDSIVAVAQGLGEWSRFRYEFDGWPSAPRIPGANIIKELTTAIRETFRKPGSPSPYRDWPEALRKLFMACFERSWKSEKEFLEGLPNDLLDTTFFITSKGYFGLGNCATVKVGDRVALVNRMTWPILLRAQGDDFLFVRECYVQGVMDGEMENCWKAGPHKLEDIVLV